MWQLHCVWRQKFCECHSYNLLASKYVSFIYILDHQVCFLGEEKCWKWQSNFRVFSGRKKVAVLRWDFFPSLFFNDKSHSEVQQEKTNKQNQISPQNRGKLCGRQVDIRDQITSKNIIGGTYETIQIQREVWAMWQGK